jgi:AcrR family transcriptional regulator
MSKNKQAWVPENRIKKDVDRRILRTRDRLGDALIALMQEKDFDDITVQEVLDRAKVGRSTFYMHYRDKDDLFMSDAEEFLEAFSMALSHHKDKSDRVAPVQEFFTHIAEGKQLYDALTANGRIHDFFELAQGHFARGIEQRLKELPRSKAMKPAHRAALSQAHAGAMLSLLKWWMDRGRKSSPKEMDETFHRMVWSGI